MQRIKVAQKSWLWCVSILAFCLSLCALFAISGNAFADELKEQNTGFATVLKASGSSQSGNEAEKQEARSTSKQATETSKDIIADKQGKQTEESAASATALRSAQETETSSTQVDEKHGSNAELAQKGVWKRNARGWWYEYPDGKYLINGIYLIDGIKYHFLPSGYMSTG